MQQKMMQSTGMKICTSLEQSYDWDKALAESEENPYPLAPVDLVRRGKVNRRSYMVENYRLGKKSGLVMIPELLRIVQEPDFTEDPLAIEILGPGLFRDTISWLRHPVTRLFNAVCATDSSTVAYEKGESLKALHKLDHLSLCKAEIEEAWAHNFINPYQTRVYYAGQVIQNLDEKAKNRWMKHFGKFLRIPTSKGRRGREVFLLHARGEDNPPRRVKWKHTIPWFDQDLRIPLEKGYGGRVNMEIIRRHDYWAKVRYVWFRISAP